MDSGGGSQVDLLTLAEITLIQYSTKVGTLPGLVSANGAKPRRKQAKKVKVVSPEPPK